jgi:hypothetical protein
VYGIYLLFVQVLSNASPFPYFFTTDQTAIPLFNYFDYWQVFDWLHNAKNGLYSTPFFFVVFFLSSIY